MTKFSSRAGLLAPSALVLAIAMSGALFADARSGATVPEKVAANRDRQEQLLARSEEIYNTADAEKRDLTKEEAAEIDENKVEFDKLERDCTRRIDLQARNDLLIAPGERRTSPTGGADDPEFRPNGSAARDVGTLAERSKTFGFKSQGDFFQAVRVASASRGVTIDERLKAAAAGAISTEGVGADGGYAVPPEYRTKILERAFDQQSLLGMSEPIPISSNSMTFPADMTTPWDASGGIQAYWEGETNPYTQSKLKLEGSQVKLAKITALVPVSDELLADNAALGGYIERKAPEKIDFKISYALAWGNGVGMPLGFMNSPVLVTQAAEGAQTTDTVNQANVSKMWSRMPAGSRKFARWLIHHDVEPQLDAMTIGNYPVYIGPGGLKDDDLGRLKGRPVIPHEICETLGDLGDVMLVDMQSYLSVKAAAGLKAQTSIHLWFDQDLTAFKFTMRIGGQPWWSAPISPRDGSNTRSPFVTLASR